MIKIFLNKRNKISYFQKGVGVSNNSCKKFRLINYKFINFKDKIFIRIYKHLF